MYSHVFYIINQKHRRAKCQQQQLWKVWRSGHHLGAASMSSGNGRSTGAGLIQDGTWTVLAVGELEMLTGKKAIGA